MQSFLDPLFAGFGDTPFLLPVIDDVALLNGEREQELVINFLEITVLLESSPDGPFDRPRLRDEDKPCVNQGLLLRLWWRAHGTSVLRCFALRG